MLGLSTVKPIESNKTHAPQHDPSQPKELLKAPVSYVTVLCKSMSLAPCAFNSCVSNTRVSNANHRNTCNLTILNPNPTFGHSQLLLSTRPIVTGPTHKKGHTGELVLSHDVSFENILRKDVSVSEHKCIMFTSVVQNNLCNNKPNLVCSYICHTSSVPRFADALLSSSADIGSSQDVDTVLNNFNNTCPDPGPIQTEKNPLKFSCHRCHQYTCPNDRLS